MGRELLYERLLCGFLPRISYLIPSGRGSSDFPRDVATAE